MGTKKDNTENTTNKTKEKKMTMAEKKALFEEMLQVVETAIAEDTSIVVAMISGGGMLQNKVKPIEIQRYDDRNMVEIMFDVADSLILNTKFKAANATKPNPSLISGIRKEYFSEDIYAYILIYDFCSIRIYAP